MIPAALSTDLAVGALVTVTTSSASAAETPAMVFVSEVNADNGSHTFTDSDGIER